MFATGPLFTANNTAQARVVVNQGGTSSGKTYTILQVLFYKAITERKIIISVVGESVPNLKKGAYRDAERIYDTSPALKPYVKFWHKTNRIIYFTNGSLIEFISTTDIQDAKSGKRDYLFVNEANGIPYEIYWQFELRTRKQVFIDYNPSAPFWAHEKLIGKPDVQLLISDHRHNPFLPQIEHDRIENTEDKELHRVYARGKTGNITGLIYLNWRRIPDDQFPDDCDNIFGGIDYGYTNDPTAAVKIARVGESIFLHELCYTPNIPTIRLKQIFTANGMADRPIYSEHDPELIAELRRLDMTVYPARKGQGSINAGIMKVKEFKVFYTESSVNIHEERQKYVWQRDPITGKPLNQPIDQFNHLMDAARYGIYTHYFTE